MGKTIFIDIDSSLQKKISLNDTNHKMTIPPNFIKFISLLHEDGLLDTKNSQADSEWRLCFNKLKEAIEYNQNKNQISLNKIDSNSLNKSTHLLKVNGSPTNCGIVELSILLFHLVEEKISNMKSGLKKIFIQIPERVFSLPVHRFLEKLEAVFNLSQNVFCPVPITQNGNKNKKS
tara:strand:+ start:1369 stop:1896 length:528 start_codon:yes stop_codon:yes gene_type:complete